MTAREALGVSLFAMALVMVGWAYLAGYECGRGHGTPAAQYVSLGDLGKQVTWLDESGCKRQAIFRGSFAS